MSRGAMNTVLLVAVLAAGMHSQVRADQPRKRPIAVLELRSRGLDADLAASLTELVVREVDRSGLFTTISLDDIRAMLQHAENSSMLGCDDATCLAEIGGALGVELLLAGSVGRVGSTHVISLRLIDVKQSRVLVRQEKTVQGEVDDLIEASRQAVRKLLQPLMDRAAGELALTCVEEGAEVYVDDMMIGTTPLDPRTIPGGFHTIKVKKDSFVVFGRDVLVRPRQTTRLEVELIPSPDFVARYRARASTYRALAWTFTGLAVAAAGTATGLLIWNEGRLGDYRQDKERYESELVGDGDELNARADSINTVDTANWVIGGVGLACLGTALYFWLAGDPPGRYDHMDRSRASGPVFDLQPAFGEGVVGATARIRY